MRGRWREAIGATIVLALLGGGVLVASADEGSPGGDATGRVGFVRAEAEPLFDRLGLDDEEDDAPWRPGTVAEGADLLPRARITVDEAVAAAQAASPGEVHGAELEREDGQLLFEIGIGDKEISVDANDGRVVSVETDD